MRALAGMRRRGIAGLCALVLALVGWGARAAGVTEALIRTSDSSWWPLLMELSRQGEALGVREQVSPAEQSVSFELETEAAFETSQATLAEPFARFMDAVAAAVGDHPGAHVTIIGFGDRPATRYNPVLLAERVRAVQRTLVQGGVGMADTQVGVRTGSEFDGDGGLRNKAAAGAVIVVRIGSRR